MPDPTELDTLRAFFDDKFDVMEQGVKNALERQHDWFKADLQTLRDTIDTLKNRIDELEITLCQTPHATTHNLISKVATNQRTLSADFVRLRDDIDAHIHLLNGHFTDHSQSLLDNKTPDLHTSQLAFAASQDLLHQHLNDPSHQALDNHLLGHRDALQALTERLDTLATFTNRHKHHTKITNYPPAKSFELRHTFTPE